MNTQAPQSLLLPSGLYDLIGPQAEAESALVSALMSYFRSCGYVHVHPPMMEFAANLLDATEESPLAQQTFQVMDPLSQQMLAVRADMTMQIARIAGSTLKDQPRPLRLCYGGQTVRTLPGSIKQSRQFRQIGIELFGPNDPAADIEVMQLAISSLRTAYDGPLTLDISLPHLLYQLLQDIPPPDHANLLKLIRHKDVSQLEHAGHPLLGALCAISEAAEPAFAKCSALALPDSARIALETCEALLSTLNERLNNDGTLTITLDPLEMRGFGYHSGLSFALYAPENSQELGRGGRYLSPHGENATGFTLYAEDILPLLNSPKALPFLRLPPHCDESTAAHWRAQGYRTLYRISGAERADYELNDDLTTIVKV